MNSLGFLGCFKVKSPFFKNHQMIFCWKSLWYVLIVLYLYLYCVRGCGVFYFETEGKSFVEKKKRIYPCVKHWLHYFLLINFCSGERSWIQTNIGRELTRVPFPLLPRGDCLRSGLFLPSFLLRCRVFMLIRYFFTVQAFYIHAFVIFTLSLLPW